VATFPTVMDAFIQLRHRLHSAPELSSREANTAAHITRFFDALAPDQAVCGLGGHGAAFVFAGETPGPTVLLRAELDALPIHEQNSLPYRSTVEGVSHKCGHDGHMAMLAAVGATFANVRPRRGRVVLLFQPAEETGQGAAAVMADERYASLRPDYAFALHNLPGFPLGCVVIRGGTFCCASRGVVVELRGTPAHAANPSAGISPAQAMCDVIAELQRVHDAAGAGDELTFATVVGATLGDKAFGTAPDRASVFATLRSGSDAGMSAVTAHVERRVRAVAERYGLAHDLAYEDVFPTTANDPACVEMVHRATPDFATVTPPKPFAFSEDFGHFLHQTDGALVGLGAGTDTPPLHDACYDFPDPLIPVGAALLCRIVDACLVGS
jgi:amidohydrolase